ncbi:MAG: NAD-dependent epimerase/dehydratase family protein [Verrucomicrobia bacterium]|nr:NAD-dependent epimerase/dehydratase family protein [Verrucomicrobiota bacterium]MDA1088111.1 NAD-dependent epimerase/dehydratase family protein [Verrucomicrobiota bacterium]
MRILVTGAAGFIGSHLAQRLRASGHDVVGVDMFSAYYCTDLKACNADALRDDGIEIERLDLSEDALDRVLDGVDVVYHAAAQPGISDTTPFEDYLKNNLVATRRLAEAAMSGGGLRAFVNVSTSSVYGTQATDPEDAEPKPTSYYGVTKLAAEQLVLAYHRDRGFPASSLRLFSVYGPRERPEKLYPKLIHSILAGAEFPLYSGSREHSRSFTYVDDIVDGFVSVLDHLDACAGEIINIGSDIEITTGRGIEIVEEILGRPARVRDLPKRAGDQLRTHAEIGKARALLGYQPSTAPEAGLAREVEWYRDEVFGKIDPYV